MKIVFMGSPRFAVPSLKALVAAGHEIVAVYSQPPRPAGRGNTLQKTPVHEDAETMGLEVCTPDKLKGESLEVLLARTFDVVCVVGFGMLLPKALVDTRVCINVHPSALPRWRGATPVQSAIMAGDGATEVCIMRLETGMDTGPVYDRTPVTITPNMTTGELNDVVWEIGAHRLVQVVAQLPTLTPTPQVGHATHAPKITGEMRPLDWRLTAWEVHNRIRGLSPTPGATCVVKGEVVKVLRSRVEPGQGKPGEVVGITDGLDVACGDGVVRILEVQRPGKKVIAAVEALKGWGLAPGEVIA